jgi:hypothetical protein
MLAGAAEKFQAGIAMFLSTQALLTGLIDYAGLFPPAALDMPSAVRNYAAYRNGENSKYSSYSWALGRFVVPVGRLGEFEGAAADFLRDDAWRLSALPGPEFDAEFGKIGEFNRRFAGKATIDTVEIKAETPETIQKAVRHLPDTITAYFEIPIDSSPLELVQTVAETGARAKVRTGGLAADAFPSSHNLARFIRACADEDVPFKATAGLHHPVRSVNKLTYEPDSASAMMHGFLNVFLAAAFAQNGMDIEALADLLEEKSPDAFQFEQGSVTWRGEMVVRGQLRNTRSLLAIAFGSCSFEEPIDDLKKLGLI